MNTKQIIIVSAIIALVVGLLGGVIGGLVAREPDVSQKGNLGAEGDTNLINLVLSGYLNVTGTTTLPGNFVTQADSRIAGNPVSYDKDSSIVSVNATATTTLTSAQVCDNPYINVSFTNSEGKATLPSAASLIADCLYADGDSLLFRVRNASATSSNTVAFLAGASSTIQRINATSTPGIAALATSTIQNLGMAELRATLITSSTPWVVWNIVAFQ